MVAPALRPGDLVSQPRVLIVCDGEAWFTRRVCTIVHDTEHDLKVYRCDKHLVGPFVDVQQAVEALAKIPKEMV